MKGIFLSLLMSLPILVNAQAYAYQPLADTSIVWHTRNDFFPLNAEISWTNQYYFSGEDTVIGLKEYQVLHRTPEAGIDTTFLFYIREDSSRRYFIHTEEGEKLLYDFKANMGDTLFLSASDTVYYHVKNIDTIEIDNRLRRRLHISGNWEPPHGGNFQTNWIEGIGDSAYGVISLFTPDLGYGFQFCGVENNGKKIFPDSAWECSAPQGVIVNHIPEPFHIYPNPASDYLYLTYSRKAELYIYDIQGRLKRQNKMAGPIPLGGLEAGIYLLYLIDTEGQQMWKRFVKH